MSHTKESIIEAGVASTLRPVIGQVVSGAGLALIRGPAGIGIGIGIGIGKTFALNLIRNKLIEDGVIVVRVTGSEVPGGSVSSFSKAVLSPYSIEAGSTWDGVEAMFDLLAGYPFHAAAPRSVFIVDEAQMLKPSLPETIRGLWDRGDAARRTMSGGKAFGCVLVVHEQGDAQRIAGFRPLRSRVTHDAACPGRAGRNMTHSPSCCFPISRNFRRKCRNTAGAKATFGCRLSRPGRQDLLLTAKDVAIEILRRAIKLMGGW